MIDVTYSLSQAEYLEAYKSWCRLELKRYPGRVLLQVAGGVFGLFLGLSLHLLPAWSWIGLCCSYGLVYLVNWWRKNAVRKFQYARGQKRWQNIHARIDESGYQSEKPGASGGWIRWSQFTEWRESSLVIILGYDAHFIAIPKSALSPEQQAELRALLAGNIKPTAV